MAKSDYIQTNDAAFGAQLNTFKTTIGSYATTLNVTPTQVTAQAADADYYNYVLATRDVIQKAAQQWNGWRDSIRRGGDLASAGAPVSPVLPSAVPAVAPGVEPRFRALVKQIKASANYNSTIGAALGIEGTAQTAPDLATLQPAITAVVSGGSVQVSWNWGGFSSELDICELEVDRGQGFGLLAFDTTPGYTDTTPLPATPTKWTYRAIYRVGDARVGQWSNPVSVTVGG